MKMRLPDGRTFLISFVALHRRHRRGVYRRPSDWLACAGDIIAWGRTQKEALARLREMAGVGSDRTNVIPLRQR